MNTLRIYKFLHHAARAVLVATRTSIQSLPNSQFVWVIPGIKLVITVKSAP